jgi:signal transduction histidine kinase
MKSGRHIGALGRCSSGSGGSCTEDARLAAMASVQALVLRIAHLTADLRRLAEPGTRSIEQIPVDLTGLLRDAVALARERPEATTRGLALTLPQPPSFLPRVSGDQLPLPLAVHNSIDNSLKFTRPGDSVEVRVSDVDRHGGQVLLSSQVGEGTVVTMHLPVV